MRNKRGITLIALVITIIVLLILAGVSINLILGDNGVLTQSQQASSKTGEATAKEDVELAWMACLTRYYEESPNMSRLDYINANLKEEVEKNGRGSISNIRINGRETEVTYTPIGKTISYEIKISAEGEITIEGDETSNSTLATRADVKLVSAPTTTGSTVTFNAGDEVTLKDEPFYVLSDNGTKIVLLAKHNLKTDGSEQYINGTYSQTAVAFSNNKYWADTWTTYYANTSTYWDPSPYQEGTAENDWTYSRWIGSQLNLNNESDYTDGDAIDLAKNYAESLGLSKSNGRLLTYEEAAPILNGSNNTMKGIIIGTSNGTSQSFLNYWLGSASDTDSVNVCNIYGSFNNLGIDNFRSRANYGVRPVLEVE